MTNFFPNRDDAGDPLLDRVRASTVGLYDVAGEIGRGGMAVVYIATDLRLGRRVAIKVMEPRLNFTPGMAERFLLEARIAAQLQHHNIIVVHEVRHDEELIFFVMRLVEGGSLDEICRRVAQKQRQIPIDQAQWILWQSARALAYAHSEGIIHRDVKPANILISTKGEVVVTDFGIAKAVDAEGLTKSGMAIGTPTYMSPEQFVGQDALSGATDQYALGIAAYEMLTGAPPFTGDLYRIIAAHGSTPAPDIREKRPDCPEPLAAALMRMLAKKPEDRWPSLDAALPVLGQGLAIDGSTTRADLATVAVELQAARAASVTAWSALTPVTPSWGGTRRSKANTRPVPAAISVSPPTAQTVVGKQLHLRAVVTSDTGTTIGDAVVTWTTSDPAIATVTSDGTVTGVSTGSAEIGAEVVPWDGSTSVVRAVAELRVTEREVARVHIREGDQEVESGEACRLTAELFDEDGNAIKTAPVIWASSEPTVAHVDEHGTLLALAGGIAIITARVGGVQGSVRVEVRMVAVATELSLGSDPRLSSPPAATSTELSLGSDTRLSSPQSATWWSKPRTLAAAAATLVVIVSGAMLATRDSRSTSGASSTSPGAPAPTVKKAAKTASGSGDFANTRTPANSSTKPPAVKPATQTGAPSENRPPTNGSDAQVSPKSAVQRPSTLPSRQPTPVSPLPAPPPQSRGQPAAITAGTNTASAPPTAGRPDSAIDRTPAPTRAPEVAGPSDNEMRRLSREYVQRLERGDFRTGSLASFFSGATSSHHASLVGLARVFRREGDALLVDVDLDLERTMGSGAVQRRVASVRLVLRGRGSAAVIESATPGAVTNAR